MKVSPVSSWVLASAAVLLSGHLTNALPTEPELEQELPPPVLDKRAAPTVTFSQGTVVGNSLLGVENYAGIPFAQSPTGELRLKPPVRHTADLGDSFDASGTGPACPQMFFSTNASLVTSLLGYLTTSPLFGGVTGQTEDCLTMRIQRPEGVAANASLPVLFWIFGGGFELGFPGMYDATPLLNKAAEAGRPFIMASVNYRVAGFGFMPGKELLEEGSTNLGLLDQRMGLEWVADNIAAFGGDPDKVTIWGESAGAISVFNQMAAYGGDINYNGKPLFRGAIMNSGSIVPAEPVDCEHCQGVYDTVVSSAGCDTEADTLACLRGLDYEDFLNAANSVPGILGYHTVALSYLPRPDGNFLPDSPHVLAENNQYAAVPMIIGDLEDEGTLFGLFTSNITTTEDLVDYFETYFFHQANRTQIEEIVGLYPDDPTQGSPFRTGIFNNPYAQYKRISAMLGDFTFTLTRRLFLAAAAKNNPSVPSWSYLASYNYGTPILGTFHGSDILQVFYGVFDNYAANAFNTYYTSFLYNLDPNEGTDSSEFQEWPQWGEEQELVWIFNNRGETLKDDFRSEAAEWLEENIDILVV